jgi:signal transduction histidine kinase
MGKITEFFKRKSIKTAFTTSMLVCIVSALLLSLALSSCCQWGQSQIYKQYQFEFGVSDPEMVIGFDRTADEQKGSISYQTPLNIMDHFTPADRTIYNILGFLSIGVYPICFIFCIVATSILFYKRHMQKPLAILDHAAGQIADNNLDFKIVYDKEDELGKLCASFEKMRQALQESNEEMWRQMEERKRLNAAFSHDLRTPLTVLKGQSELLRQYAPQMTAEKLSDTSEMMHRHIVRLEEYVQTMGELQRLEDIEIVRHSITLGALCRQLEETGEAVCDKKGFSYEVIGNRDSGLNIDASIVMRVYENLLANAVRFAKEKIMVSAESQEGYLYLTVSDDGAGFAKKDLENATKPFYKTVRETDNEHFGMGLNICKILCEKHGGYIRLSNRDGAVVTAAFRQ